MPKSSHETWQVCVWSVEDIVDALIIFWGQTYLHIAYFRYKQQPWVVPLFVEGVCKEVSQITVSYRLGHVWIAWNGVESMDTYAGFIW